MHKMPERPIPDEVWKKHFHDGLRYDGERFEVLAHTLLNAQYGKGWEATGRSHDGSRDFVLGQHNMWAECKAYSQNLAFHPISPTLVMAFLNKPTKLIFISRSPLVDSAVKVLGQYEHSSGIEVAILDGVSLDLAIMHHPRILKKYFPNEKFSPPSSLPVTCLKSLSIDVTVHPTRLDFEPGGRPPAAIPGEQVDVARYGILRMDVLFKNPHADSVRQITATCEMDQNSAEALEILKFGMEGESDREGEHRVSIDVPPSGVTMLQLIVRVMRSGTYPLPDISLEGDVEPQTVSFGSVECSGIFEVPLVGESPRDHLKSFAQLIEGRRTFTACLLDGRSGVGKSRLVNEMARKAVVKGYRSPTVDFARLGDKSPAEAVRALVAMVHDLPLLEPNSDQEKDLRDKAADGATPSTTVLRAIYDTSYDVLENFTNLLECLVGQLCRTKIALVIDNMQEAPDEIAELLNHLIARLAESSRHCSSTIVLAFNVDLLSEVSKAQILYDSMKGCAATNDNIRRFEVLPFKPADVDEFITRALAGPKSNELAQHYRLTFGAIQDGDGANTPLHLWLTLQYLMDTGVLHVVNGRLEATATYTENLPRALERIPPQIQNLLELRWDRILANARAEDRSPEALEWAVTAAYALSDLPAQGDGRIGVAQGTVQRLMNAGIFRQQENRAVFFHQSHFRFFRERNKTIEQQKAKQLLRYLDEEQEEGAFQQRFLLTYHADKLDDDAVEQTLATIKAMGLGVKYGVEVCNNLIKHLDERSVELSGMALRGYDTAGDWLQRLVDLKTGANVYKAAETRLHKDKDAAMPGDVPMPETVDFYVRAINTSLSVGQDERALSFVQRALEVIRGDLGVAKIKYRRSAIEKELYKLDEAGTDCRAALAVFRRSRECALVVDALYDLSEIEFARKETMQAGEAALREGNDLAQQLEGAQALEKISRYPLGCAKTLMLSGRYDEAVHYAKKGAKSCLSKRDHFWGIRCRQFEVLVHLLHARVANEADRMEALQAAKEALHWAQDLFNATGMERSRAELPYLWGKYHIAIGAHEAAARDFSRACDQLNDQLRPPRGRPYQLHAAGNGDAPRVEWYEQFYLDMACSLGEIGLALETSVLNAIPSDRVIESVRDLIGSPQDRAEHWQQVSWEPYCLDVDPPYFIALRW